MAHVTFRGVTDEVRGLVDEFIGKLEAAGHGGTVVTGSGEEPALDPFAGMDVDAIPEQLLAQTGISREELRRGRNAPPAVDVNSHQAAPERAAPAAPAAQSAPVPAGG